VNGYAALSAHKRGSLCLEAIWECERLIWIFAISVLMFLGALVLVPVIVVRMPADYFSQRRRRSPPSSLNPILRWTCRIATNTVGGLLVLAGIAMLVLPGQGILTILIGLSLMEFPGKYSLERWIVQQGPVLAAINALRQRFGRGPLEIH
jgi:hypothetical protein